MKKMFKKIVCSGFALSILVFSVSAASADELSKEDKTGGITTQAIKDPGGSGE